MESPSHNKKKVTFSPNTPSEEGLINTRKISLEDVETGNYPLLHEEGLITRKISLADVETGNYPLLHEEKEKYSLDEEGWDQKKFIPKEGSDQKKFIPSQELEKEIDLILDFSLHEKNYYTLSTSSRVSGETLLSSSRVGKPTLVEEEIFYVGEPLKKISKTYFFQCKLSYLREQCLYISERKLKSPLVESRILDSQIAHFEKENEKVIETLST